MFQDQMFKNLSTSKLEHIDTQALQVINTIFISDGIVSLRRDGNEGIFVVHSSGRACALVGPIPSPLHYAVFERQSLLFLQNSLED